MRTSHRSAVDARQKWPPPGVTLKCLPHEKSALGEIITELTCLLNLLLIIGLIKSFPIIGSPPQKSSPGRQFAGKNPSRPGAPVGRSGFLPVNCRLEETSGGSYNGTPALFNGRTVVPCFWRIYSMQFWQLIITLQSGWWLATRH